LLVPYHSDRLATLYYRIIKNFGTPSGLDTSTEIFKKKKLFLVSSALSREIEKEFLDFIVLLLYCLERQNFIEFTHAPLYRLERSV
jgi:hypothetical protein